MDRWESSRDDARLHGMRMPASDSQRLVAALQRRVLSSNPYIESVVRPFAKGLPISPSTVLVRDLIETTAAIVRTPSSDPIQVARISYIPT